MVRVKVLLVLQVLAAAIVSAFVPPRHVGHRYNLRKQLSRTEVDALAHSVPRPARPSSPPPRHDQQEHIVPAPAHLSTPQLESPSGSSSLPPHHEQAHIVPAPAHPATPQLGPPSGSPPPYDHRPSSVRRSSDPPPYQLPASGHSNSNQGNPVSPGPPQTQWQPSTSEGMTQMRNGLDEMSVSMQEHIRFQRNRYYSGTSGNGGVNSSRRSDQQAHIVPRPATPSSPSSPHQVLASESSHSNSIQGNPISPPETSWFTQLQNLSPEERAAMREGFDRMGTSLHERISSQRNRLYPGTGGDMHRQATEHVNSNRRTGLKRIWHGVFGGGRDKGRD